MQFIAQVSLRSKVLDDGLMSCRENTCRCSLINFIGKIARNFIDAEYRPRVNGRGFWTPFSNQNRSPDLRSRNCVAKIQVNVGPTIAPGKCFSEIPAAHKSTSSTCLRTRQANETDKRYDTMQDANCCRRRATSYPSSSEQSSVKIK